MIDLSVNQDVRKRNIERCRERGVILPTFAQMRDPERVPESIQRRLRKIGLWDVDPLNLFRINWRNEPVFSGGAFGNVNYVEFPSELTGVPARIVALVGKWFPTGAHKVGATYGCLAPALATGSFDSTKQKAVWPSTGNYCRGGAFNSALLGCESVAILPEQMSRERFEWLSTIAGEVISTPGSESNVKEIFDKCHELSGERGDNVVIFNQFDQFGNYLWHYEVTGPALQLAAELELRDADRICAFVCATGSAGTIAAGDYLKSSYPDVKIAAAEAMQCPTLLCNGFGAHRIEGIGDKHVPWIHNIKNTDVVIAVDDQDCINLLRLFNEPEGRRHLSALAVADAGLEALDLVGISGIGNLIASIKLARYFELTEHDVIMTVLTDSPELYKSRLAELRQEEGDFDREKAIRAHSISIEGIRTDSMLELSYLEKKRIHNLKYYTWIEQQGKSIDELDAQWYDPEYWAEIPDKTEDIDELIGSFNDEVGVGG